MRYQARTILRTTHRFFYPMIWSMASKPTALGQPDPVRSPSSCNPSQMSLSGHSTMTNCVFTFRSTRLWLFPQRYGPDRTRKAKGSRVRLSFTFTFTASKSHIETEAMHNISAHQPPRYWQLQRVPWTASTALVMWYTRRKLALANCNTFNSSL